MRCLRGNKTFLLCERYGEHVTHGTEGPQIAVPLDNFHRTSAACERYYSFLFPRGECLLPLPCRRWALMVGSRLEAIIQLPLVTGEVMLSLSHVPCRNQQLDNLS